MFLQQRRYANISNKLSHWQLSWQTRSQGHIMLPTMPWPCDIVNTAGSWKGYVERRSLFLPGRFSNTMDVS